jgi:hypothetical protein
MAVVIRCDFCEKIVDNYVTISFMVLDKKGYMPQGCTKQLCMTCSKEIVNMIMNGKEKMNGQ